MLIFLIISMKWVYDLYKPHKFQNLLHAKSKGFIAEVVDEKGVLSEDLCALNFLDVLQSLVEVARQWLEDVVG